MKGFLLTIQEEGRGERQVGGVERGGEEDGAKLRQEHTGIIVKRRRYNDRNINKAMKDGKGENKIEDGSKNQPGEYLYPEVNQIGEVST